MSQLISPRERIDSKEETLSIANQLSQRTLVQKNQINFSFNTSNTDQKDLLKHTPFEETQNQVDQEQIPTPELFLSQKNGLNSSKTVDPMNSLHLLEEVLWKWRKQDWILTPFNYSQVIQTLNIPNRPGEVITVSIVTNNLVQKSVNIDRSFNDHVMRCTYKFKSKDTCLNHMGEDTCVNCPEQVCDRELYAVKQTKSYKQSKVKCDHCKQEIKHDSTKQCSYFDCQSTNHTEKMNYCLNCVIRHYARLSLFEKTSEHFYYEDYHLVQEDQIATQRSINDDQFSDFVNMEQQKCKVEKMEQQQIYEKSLHETHASVAFWNYNHSDPQSPTCYYQIKIKNPLTILTDTSQKQLKMASFLFLSDDNTKLFYFNRDSNEKSTLIYNEVKLVPKVFESNTNESNQNDRKEQIIESDLIFNNLKSCKITGEAKTHIENYFESDQAILSIPRLVSNIELRGTTLQINILCIATQNQQLQLINCDTSTVIASLPARVLLRNYNQSLQQIQEIWYLKVESKHVYTLHQAEWLQGQPLVDVKVFSLQIPQEKPEINYIDAMIEGYLHKDSKTCTISINHGNYTNWLTYNINQPLSICDVSYKNLHTKDCFIVQDPTTGDLNLYGNLKQIEISAQSEWDRRQSKGFDWFSLEVINLDNFKMKQSLDLQLSNEFSYLGHLQKYKMKPFSLIHNQLYQSQLFYLDESSGMPNVFFVLGKLSLKSSINQVTDSASKQAINVALLPWMMPNVKYFIEYPILVYSTCDPMQNVLMLCNLQKNQSQKRLYLEELNKNGQKQKFQFKSFVNPGSNNFQQDSQKFYVFFLALNQQKVQLFQLDVNPYKQMEENFLFSEVKFQLLKFPSEEIKKAALITHSKQSNSMALIVQFKTQILVFHPEQDPKIVVDSNEMAPLHMISRWNRCYFVKRSDSEGDEIFCIKFDKTQKNITWKSEYKRKVQILQIQTHHAYIEQQSDFRILILDDSYRLTELKYKNYKTHACDQTLVEHQFVDLSERPLKRVIRALQLIPWSKCVLQKKALLCGYYHQLIKDKKEYELKRQQTVYSLRSTNFAELPYFDFRTNSSDLEKLCIDIEHIRGVGQTISLVKESHMCYFNLRSLPTIRRVDIMTFHRQKLLKSNFFVLNNSSFLVSIQSQPQPCFMIFDQNTLMLKKIENFKLKDILENVNGEESLLSVESQESEKHVLILSENSDHQNLKILDQDDCDPLFLQKLKPCENQYKQVLCRQIYFKSKSVIILSIYQDTYKNLSSQKIQEFHIAQFQTLDIQYYCIHFENIKFVDDKENFNDELHTLVTENYVVFYLRDKVFYLKKEQISTIDPLKQFELSSLKKCTTEAQGRVCSLKNLTNFGRKTTSSDVKIINIDQLFFGQKNYDAKSNYIITSVSQKDKYMLINDSKNDKTDAIQISFENNALIWDLSCNSEISSFQKTSDFNKIKTFTRTGFRYYRCEKDSFRFLKGNQDYTFTFLQGNQDYSLISVPQTETQPSCLFRTFSNLDLREIMHLKEMVKSQKTIKLQNIPRELLAINIQNHTFYTIFYKQPQMLDLVLKMVQQVNLKMHEDVEENTIFLRRLFYTIFSPFSPSTKMNSKNKKAESKISIYKKRYLTPLEKLQADVSRKWQMLFQKYNNKVQSDNVPDQETEWKTIQFNQNSMHQNSLARTENEKKSLSLGISSNRNENVQIDNHCNFVQYLIRHDRPEFEKMIQIMLMCNNMDVTFRSLIQNFDDFKKVFSLQCKQMNDFMVKALIQTPMTKQVTSMKWIPRKKRIVFTAETAMYSNQTIISKAEEKMRACQEDPYQILEIKIVEVSWLNGHIPEFYNYLQKVNRSSLYENELIKVLLKYSKSHITRIQFFIFLPYCLYMILLLYFFLTYKRNLTNNQKFIDSENYLESLFRILITLETVFLTYIELIQMKKMTIYCYFWSGWNILNLISIFINQYIIVMQTTPKSEEAEITQAILTGLACALLWFMMFYWMRLFKFLALYVKILQEIFWDMGQFIAFFTMSILCFGISQLIIYNYYQNQSDLQNSEPQEVFPSQTASHFTDSLIFEYQLGLGQFVTTPFAQTETQSIQVVIFVLSTFITNIIFLNMIISIISHSFNKISDHSERETMQQQTEIQADFINLIKVDQDLNLNKFIYIISPYFDEEKAGTQDKKFSSIKKKLYGMERHQQDQQEKFQLQNMTLMNGLKDQLETAVDKQSEISKSSTSNQLEELNSFVMSQREMTQQIKQLNAKLQNIRK